MRRWKSASEMPETFPAPGDKFLVTLGGRLPPFPTCFRAVRNPHYLNKPSLFDMLSKKTGGTLWIQKKNYLHGLTAYFQGYTDPKTTLIYVELASRTVQYEYERVADLKASEVQRLYCPPMLRIAS